MPGFSKSRALNTKGLLMNRMNRRALLQAAALSPLATFASTSIFADKPARKKLHVAGIASVYKNNSHADVILGKIMEGYNQQGGPGPDLCSQE